MSYQFSDTDGAFLQSYLPVALDKAAQATPLPFVTLAFAASLDSGLSLSSDGPTSFWGPESLALTHYLRSKFDAILIAVGTAIADDPGLNCRLDCNSNHPTPVIIDPHARWDINPSTKLLRNCQTGNGRGPMLITAKSSEVEEKRRLLDAHGGKLITLEYSNIDGSDRFEWEHVFQTLAQEGLKSVMIEGGAVVLNDLLESRNAHLVDSVIAIISPTYLGKGSVVVSPRPKIDEQGSRNIAVRFRNVKWRQMGEDAILCGTLRM